MRNPEEEAEYLREHVRIFGHVPIADLRTGSRCGHPMHDVMRAVITNIPPDALVIEFDPREVLVDDEMEIDPEGRTRFNA